MDAELAYLAWQAEEEKTIQKNIVAARDYFDGAHDVPLTDRQKEWLGFNLDERRFAVNYCKIIVNAVVDRLLVRAFTCDDETLATRAWDWWQANRMDALQREVHQGAVRDQEYFVIVDWDEEVGAPRFYPHERYTAAQFGGTGYGCKAHYTDEHSAAQMKFASKRWVETTGEKEKRRTVQRMTVYYPDRIEKYELEPGKTEAQWKRIETVPWVGKNGEPLGIPVVHFRNAGGKTELWDAIPIQDVINKTALDILASADASGFRIYYMSGGYATTDGKAPEDDGDNYLKLFPGCIIGHPDPNVRMDVIEGVDLRPLLDGLDNLVLKLAQVTDTPISRFQLTRQVSAEGTLKQQEEPLLAKVRARQVLFGNGWEDCLAIARRQVNAFGAAQLNEDATFETQWAPAETRDEKVHLEQLELKGKLGIPMETLWAEMGYDQETIAEMRAQRAETMAETSNVGGELLRAFERGQ